MRPRCRWSSPGSLSGDIPDKVSGQINKRQDLCNFCVRM
ncbi:hypothetical protein ABI_32030 [Asticcacaulis biprosthecium C19]|uniref:Uncharacterized protein n=1 Tax=Asticcacaulis biprosthecium C19 TaxID=715226 RepID=F4QPQ1_9CAUL|nr:hypothetical protein ABI_32030 [Asticcacaulis biprosthecium C19]